ncbi:hypothetical protein F5Y04DRAFT_281666 [Hypomontagnella monticulosa]|nr:hypothetical protein F5Y04DRAFT_281666 [Hypomontagnella monticulosa]
MSHKKKTKAKTSKPLASEPPTPELPTFRHFPRLPAELRVMVWNYALAYESSQMHIVMDIRDKDIQGRQREVVWLLLRPDILSSIIGACTESRDMALKVYTTVLMPRSILPGCVRVNLARATLVHIFYNNPLPCKQSVRLTEEQRGSIRKMVRVNANYHPPCAPRRKVAPQDPLFPNLELREVMEVGFYNGREALGAVRTMTTKAFVRKTRKAQIKRHEEYIAQNKPVA